MKTAAIITALLVLTGCSAIGKIGSIGIHDIYSVQFCDMISPCTTTILTHSTKDGALNKIEGGTGPSILGQVLGPASVATAGYFIGDGISESGDKISETNNLSSKSEGSTAQSAGGAASATGGTSKAYAGSSSHSTAGATSLSVSGALSNSSANIKEQPKSNWGW